MYLITGLNFKNIFILTSLIISLTACSTNSTSVIKDASEVGYSAEDYFAEQQNDNSSNNNEVETSPNSEELPSERIFTLGSPFFNSSEYQYKFNGWVNERTFLVEKENTYHSSRAGKLYYINLDDSRIFTVPGENANLKVGSFEPNKIKLSMPQD